MRTGSGSLHASREHGQIFRPNEIAKIRSASARICIVREISSNGSSTRSSNAGVSRPDTTNSANYLAFVKLAAIRIWLRVNESTPYQVGFARKNGLSSLRSAVRLVPFLDVRWSYACPPCSQETCLALLKLMHLPYMSAIV